MIAEGTDQFVQNLAFFIHAHRTDFSDNLFPAPVVQEEKEQDDRKKDTKN